MTETIDSDLEDYIKQTESSASNKTRNFINTLTAGMEDNHKLLVKHAFYSGFSYGWNDRTTNLSCAGSYPSDEELKSDQNKEE